MVTKKQATEKDSKTIYDRRGQQRVERERQRENGSHVHKRRSVNTNTQRGPYSCGPNILNRTQ